jgi:outer membrane protein assembly factor BamB
MIYWRLILAGVVGASIAGPAVGDEPRLKWAFKAESNLYAPPLIADLCPAPGKETVLSDSEARRLRCIDATGKPVWEYGGGWTKRLTNGAALSISARPGKATLVVGNSDGKVGCIDGETGTGLWQRQVGAIEWGQVLWADLNGDGRDEVVAGTESSGIIALDADGNVLWTYTGQEGEKPLVIRCPIAAADIDGDKRQEVFAAGQFGPVCVNGDGTRRWATLTGDDFVSGVVIADADGDGAPEAYCSSRNENATWCFNARTGEIRWKAAMAAGADTYPSSSLAVGDVDQDGKEEIVAPDAAGYVYCISCAGEIRWVFATEKRTHAAASMGDVDGDGEIEVLIASGDHYLYCVDAAGELKWRYKADLRLIGPGTITDIDNDGKTDILFCGSDRTLRCITLEGWYRPELAPWPSRRFDAEQSGSSFGKRSPAESRMVIETVSLLSYGGFEQGLETEAKDDYPKGSDLYEMRQRRPRGWHNETGPAETGELDTAARVAGASSMKVRAGEDMVSYACDYIDADPKLRSVSARVYAKGDGIPKASLRWRGLRGVVREDPLARQEQAEHPEWTAFSIKEAPAARGARWLQLVCMTEKGTIWWDEAEILGTFARSREAEALVNQAGYDLGAPKRFTVQSNFTAREAAFEVISGKGHAVFKGPLRHEGRIRGGYDNDWGHEYWRGDFSAFDAAGTYRIRVALDDVSGTSWPFELGEDLLWEKTAGPAYRFFYYQRCGTEVPGFHRACHLDDAVSPDGKRQYALWGGWHDAGDYNTYDNAPYVLGLATAYGVRKETFDRQDADGNGVSDFLDEILWGGEHTRRMIAPDGSAFGPITSGYGFWAAPELETDNQPNTGDERRISGNETGNDSSVHAAAMAKIARYSADKGPWLEAAQRALDRALANNQRGPLQFSAALDLYAATRDERYAALAKKLFPGANLDVIYAVRLYDAVFHEDHSAALRDQLAAKAEEMLALAQNPFGVYTFGPKEKPNFFGTPRDGGGWHVGTSSHVLQAAGLAALAYASNPDRRYLEFVYDQFNWVLGNNPYDISLVEGVGSAFPPTYHQRLMFAGVARGAIPGSIVNGITWRAAGDDRPYFDMRSVDIPAYESNEVWLPHNTAFLNALANLYAARPLP